MAESAAAPAPVSTTEAPAKGEQATTQAPVSALEEMLELALEEGKPPVKVPISKVNPQLAKFRAEADRKLSEADKLSKAHAGERAKFEKVLGAAKDKPEEFLAFVEAKGGDPEKILRALGQDPDEWAKQRMTAAIQKIIREQEEEAEPQKRVLREQTEELESLRKDKATRDAEAEKAKSQETYAGLRDTAIGALQLMPEDMRGDAAPEVVAIMRAAHDEKRTLTLAQIAEAAQKYIEDRAEREYKRNAKLRERLGAKPPVVEPPKHPAAEAPPPKEKQGKGHAKRESKTYSIDQALPALLRGEDPAKWPSN